MKFNSDLEELFYKRFNDLNLKFITSEKNLDIRLYRPVTLDAPYDFSVKVSNKTIAIIEIRTKNLIERYDYSRIEKYASEKKIRYVILSDTENFILSDLRNSNKKIEVTFDDLISILTLKSNIDVNKSKQEIADTITNFISASTFSSLEKQFSDLGMQIFNGIEFNAIYETFSFKDTQNINSIENKLFRYLLQDDKPLKKIYRYTSLNSILSTLNYNSFRMNCLVGMNDTTEVNYATNYITDTNQDYTQALWPTVDAYNRRFISSCSLKEDDLTQWRLYADDSKGVCLVLSVDEKLLNSKFVLKRISYGNKDGSHSELDFIKGIIASIKNKLGIDFEFKTLSTWRHFFKPFEYSVEEEVRLLFILNDEDVKKGWLLTSSHSILNPYVEFKLNDDIFPLQLTEIVLGPKCPEKEINQKQFQQLIRELRNKKKKVKIKDIEQVVDEYNIQNLSVSISKIKNYR